MYMCVCFTLNRSFYPSTYNTTNARADSSTLERGKFCGNKTTPQRYYIVTYRDAVSTTEDNTMPCSHTKYDAHDIHIL